MTFHARRHGALLDLASLIDHPGPHAPPAARAAGGILQPTADPRTTYRPEGIPARTVDEPLRALRRPVPQPAPQSPIRSAWARRWPRPQRTSRVQLRPHAGNKVTAAPAASPCSTTGQPRMGLLSWAQCKPQSPLVATQQTSDPQLVLIDSCAVHKFCILL